MTVVVDSSAVVRMLTASRASPMASHPVIDGHDIHAPHVIDPEVLNAVRRLLLLRRSSLDDAELMVERFIDLELVRYSHAPLIERAWSLRDNITPYDALYVALAERLQVPLITTDRRLARAAAQHCEVITMD